MREPGVVLLENQLSHKAESGGFRIFQDAQPVLLVRVPKSQPFVELLSGDAVDFPELFQWMQAGKVFTKHPKDEKEPITGIRDDEIREDGMGMVTTIAVDSENTEIVSDLISVSEVDDVPPIVGMDPTLSHRTTDGAGLQFWPELSHERYKNRF